MKIARLEVEAFQGAPDGAYDFAVDGGVAPLSVVQGGPRTGKTSLLAAIAAAKEIAGPTGVPPSAARVLRQGAARGRVEATWLLSVQEAELARTSDTLVSTRWTFSRDGSSVDAPAGLRKLFARFSLADEVSKLELIPEELSTEATRAVPELPALKSQRAVARADKYAWAPAVLAQAMLGEAIAVRGKLREQGMVVEGEVADSTERFRRAMLAVAGHLRLGPLTDFGDGTEPTFSTAARPEGLRWVALAASERRALSLAIAAVHLGLSRSLVLWDSPDRAFGPRAYPDALHALKDLLPDAQIVLALDAAEPPPPAAKVLALC